MAARPRRDCRQGWLQRDNPPRSGCAHDDHPGLAPWPTPAVRRTTIKDRFCGGTTARCSSPDAPLSSKPMMMPVGWQDVRGRSASRPHRSPCCNRAFRSAASLSCGIQSRATAISRSGTCSNRQRAARHGRKWSLPAPPPAASKKHTAAQPAAATVGGVASAPAGTKSAMARAMELRLVYRSSSSSSSGAQPVRAAHGKPWHRPQIAIITIIVIRIVLRLERLEVHSRILAGYLVLWRPP